MRITRPNVKKSLPGHRACCLLLSQLRTRSPSLAVLMSVWRRKLADLPRDYSSEGQ